MSARKPKHAPPAAHKPTAIVTSEQFALKAKYISSPLPSGEVLDGLSRHIVNVGERWMVLFENNVAHQEAMDTRHLDTVHEVDMKVLSNIETEIKRDGNNTRRAQWIVGGLIMLIVIVIWSLLHYAYNLAMVDKYMPATIFTVFAMLAGAAIKYLMSGFKTRPKPTA